MTEQPPGAAPAFAAREPRDALAGIVRCLWFLQAPTRGSIERILPIPYLHVIVNLGEPYVVLQHGADRVDLTCGGPFVSGLQSTYLVNRNPAVLHHVGAELEPYAWAALGAEPFADEVRPGGDVLPALDAVRPDALAAGDPAGAMDALEDALESSLTGAQPDPIAAAVALEIARDPSQSIGDVAASVGAAASSLAGRFRRATGVTPKSHADVHRFHRFLEAVAQPGELPTWTQLVADTNFYDQPHFIRSFTKFAGVSPKRYLRDLGADGRAAPSFVATEGE